MLVFPLEILEIGLSIDFVEKKKIIFLAVHAIILCACSEYGMK